MIMFNRTWGMQKVARRGVAGIAVLAILSLAACSSDGAAQGGTTGEYEAPPVATDAQIAEFTTQVMGQPTDPSELPEIAQEAFSYAAAPITSELREKLLECMDKPVCETGREGITVGLALPFVSEPASISGKAVFLLQALRHPNVAKIISTDDKLDAATAQSNMRSLISQKVDVIVGNFVMGAALLQVAKQATAAGIPVITINSGIPGAVPGKDITFKLEADACAMAREVVGHIIESTEPGEIALFTGPAGNPYAGKWVPCAEETVSEAGGEGWSVSNVGNTDWTTQGEQAAINALIASGREPAAIIYDTSQHSFVKAYANYSGDTPLITSVGGARAGLVRAVKEAGMDPAQVIVSNSQHPAHAIGMTAAVKAAYGEELPSEEIMPWGLYPLENLLPAFDDSLDDQLPLDTGLPTDLLNEILGVTLD